MGGAMICIVMQPRKVAPHRLFKQRAAELQASINLSCWYTVMAVFLLSPLHGLQDLYSRVAMPCIYISYTQIKSTLTN